LVVTAALQDGVEVRLDIVWIDVLVIVVLFFVLLAGSATSGGLGGLLALFFLVVDCHDSDIVVIVGLDIGKVVIFEVLIELIDVGIVLVVFLVEFLVLVDQFVVSHVVLGEEGAGGSAWFAAVAGGS
jgi:hypothetical protein